MKRILLILPVFMVIAFAGDFEDAHNAYEAGDYKKAVALFQKCAEQGYAPAQYNLGVMYDKGIGVKQNHTKAVELYNTAIEQEDVIVQFDLAHKHYRSWGLTR